MYNHISGTLDSKTPTAVVVDAGGVGYLLLIPFSTASALPQVGQRVKLFTYLHVTDEALALFGFATEEEREFFIQLMKVNGVGPKLALAVLSGGR
ncbi:MAG: Holliday junction branch migration protein RuvA, partial [Planctomycetota bacterium]